MAEKDFHISDKYNFQHTLRDGVGGSSHVREGVWVHSKLSIKQPERMNVG